MLYESKPEPNLSKITKLELLAEFLGTLALVFTTCIVTTWTQIYPSFDLLALCIAQTFVVAAFVQAFIDISGAHFNICVSISMYISHHLSAKRLF